MPGQPSIDLNRNIITLQKIDEEIARDVIARLAEAYIITPRYAEIKYDAMQEQLIVPCENISSANKNQMLSAAKMAGWQVQAVTFSDTVEHYDASCFASNEPYATPASGSEQGAQFNYAQQLHYQYQYEAEDEAEEEKEEEEEKENDEEEEGNYLACVSSPISVRQLVQFNFASFAVLTEQQKTFIAAAVAEQYPTEQPQITWNDTDKKFSITLTKNRAIDNAHYYTSIIRCINEKCLPQFRTFLTHQLWGTDLRYAELSSPTRSTALSYEESSSSISSQSTLQYTM